MFKIFREALYIFIYCIMLEFYHFLIWKVLPMLLYHPRMVEFLFQVKHGLSRTAYYQAFVVRASYYGCCTYFQIIHGNQSCGGHVLSFFIQAYKRAIPVYLPVYLIPALIVHRQGLLKRYRTRCFSQVFYHLFFT